MFEDGRKHSILMGNRKKYCDRPVMANNVPVLYTINVEGMEEGMGKERSVDK